MDENPNDQTIKMQLCIYEEDKKGREGYFLKFDTLKDYNIFQTKINPASSPSTLTNRTHDENSTSTNSIEKIPTKTTTPLTVAPQSQSSAVEFNKLIIYFQTVKLKEYNINKAQDLLGKILELSFSLFVS